MKKKSVLLGMLLASAIFVSIENGEKKVNASSYYSSVTALTAEEVKLYAAHPIKAAKAKECATIAEDATITYWKGYTAWQGNGDAFRHASWSALMTKNINRTFAYKAGLAHEGLDTDYNWDKQSDDTKMDISNNYAGRDIGADYSDCTNQEILNKVLARTKNGKLKRIRVYASSSSKTDAIVDGVGTNYVGYYVATSNGGLK